MTASRVTVSGSRSLPARAVRAAAEQVLRGEGRDAALSIAFLAPGDMQRLNRDYKGHDRPTDVLAFALPQPDGSLAGDVYICRDVAATQARELGIPLREELLRLVVHGTLHVLGWDHPESAAREQSPMWQQQERYLRELG